MEVFRAQQVKQLSNCIEKSMDGTDFRWEIFFREWYRNQGTPLFFLFKKNLSVTNVQFVELFSLLTKYSKKNINRKKSSKLLFYSTEHIKITFTEVINILLEDYKPGQNQKIEKFADRYLEIINSSIAVDMFFGSCSIFLPPGVDVNLERIVFDSGYIHSAGKSLYIRNIKKAKKSEFLNSLCHYADNNYLGKQVPFVVYSHEDFSSFDKDSADLITKGIDHCKIYVEKMSMGSYRLSSIINEIHKEEKLTNKLIVPKAGNYQTEHKFRQENTVWLISDRSVSSGQIRNPGLSRYYICYEQTFKNSSPFYYFDENKPAWKSHTTMPHSLTAALLNIAIPPNFKGIICDPFGGTGTTWLEAKRLLLSNKVISSDLSPCTNQLLIDNLEFFCLDVDKLIDLIEKLRSNVPKKENNTQFQFDFDKVTAGYLDPYGQAIELLSELKRSQSSEDQEFFLSELFVQKLKQLPFLNRILFYIALRAELRFQDSFKRKSLDFEEAFKKSLEKLIAQIQMLVDLKSEICNSIDLDEAKSDLPYIKSIGKYSIKLTPSLIFKKSDSLIEVITKEVFSAKDARKLKKNSVDIIICDPPYGVNTHEDGSMLAGLYSEFIDNAILALRTMGQLIMCLPAESYTGHLLPYCTRNDLVSRQIITKAHKHGRLVYMSAQSIPSQSLLPPYYWESEKALRRTILHFRFL